MSLSLSLYVVDPDAVQAVVGSGDIRTRRAIGGRFKREMAQDDDYFADRIEEGAPTRYEALTAVVDGGPFVREHAFQYGYAYRMIADFHGRRLYSNNFSPFRFGWLARVDEGLAALGVRAVTVSEFGYGLPDPLPDTDLPGHGVWTPPVCTTALDQYNAADPAAFAALDPEVREAVEDCGAWLNEAVASGRGIVGFMS